MFLRKRLHWKELNYFGKNSRSKGTRGRKDVVLRSDRWQNGTAVSEHLESKVSLVSELILGEETTDSLLPITSELPSIPGGSDCCVPTLGARIQSQFPRYPSSLSRCHTAMASSCVQENFWCTRTFGPGHNFGLGMAS